MNRNRNNLLFSPFLQEAAVGGKESKEGRKAGCAFRRSNLKSI